MFAALPEWMHLKCTYNIEFTKNFMWASPFFVPLWQLEFAIVNYITGKARFRTARATATAKWRKNNKIMNMQWFKVCSHPCFLRRSWGTLDDFPVQLSSYYLHFHNQIWNDKWIKVTVAFNLKDAKELLKWQFCVLVSNMIENLLCQNWDCEKKMTFF